MDIDRIKKLAGLSAQVNEDYAERQKYADRIAEAMYAADHLLQKYGEQAGLSLDDIYEMHNELDNMADRVNESVVR